MKPSDYYDYINKDFRDQDSEYKFYKYLQKKAEAIIEEIELSFFNKFKLGENDLLNLKIKLDNKEKPEEKYEEYSTKDLVLGKYVDNENSRNPKIILYLLNISECCSSTKQKKGHLYFDDLVMSTFAHELFHFFHYHHLNRDPNFKDLYGKDYKCKLVVESLAARFEYEYAKRYLYFSSEYCRKKKNTWKSKDKNWYPYSGALTLLKKVDRFDFHQLDFDYNNLARVENNFLYYIVFVSSLITCKRFAEASNFIDYPPITNFAIRHFEEWLINPKQFYELAYGELILDD